MRICLTKSICVIHMTVAELIKKLEKMPQDKQVIMFDGPSYYTPLKVYICEWKEKRFNGKVVID